MVDDGSANLHGEFVVRHTIPDPHALKFEVFGPYLARDAINEDDGITYPYQRKVWHAAGRRWIFYVWSYKFRYISSLDGVSWTAPTTIRVAEWKEYGRQISTWVEADGSFHYVYGANDSGVEPRYRKGQLESDGTITWAAAEQVLSSLSHGSYCRWPSICVDVNGYPWIGFYYFASPATRRAYIITSTTKDGTWTTNPNYGSRGLQLNTASLTAWAVIPVPLANGKVAAYYGGGNATKFWVRLCDGDGIGDEAEASSGGDWDNYYTGAAIALGDIVIAGFGSTDLTIRLCRWENEAWASEITIQTGVQANTCPAFFRVGNIIFVTWIDTVADEIRYKVSRDEGATWEPSGDTSHSVLLADPSGMGGSTRYSMGYEARSTLGFSYVRAGDLIMYGWLEPETAPDLFSQFEVGQGSEDLPAQFDVGQDSEDLPGEFIARQETSITLSSEFIVLHTGAVELLSGFEVGQDAEDLPAEIIVKNVDAEDLPAEFIVSQWQEDLHARFRVENVYDLRGTAGIAFYWQGADNPPESIVDFIVESPTGFWVAEFYDGPARLRYVFIPWTQFRETGIDGSRPDMSRVDGFIYIVHTDGRRRIDYIHAPIFGDLYAFFNIRHTATPRNLKTSFSIRRTAVPLNLKAEFTVRHEAGVDLTAGFTSQAVRDLPAEFVIRHPASADLRAEFTVA